jgi:hypothetical protein
MAREKEKRREKREKGHQLPPLQFTYIKNDLRVPK